MSSKAQRHLEKMRFAWRVGASLLDRLKLCWLLSKHILVNRRLAQHSRQPIRIRIRYAGQQASVVLRDNLTDGIIFEDVFGQECYALALPTSPRSLVDAGANIGLASLYFSMRHPGVTIHSFEPVEHVMCRRNASSVHPHALGREQGQLQILIDPLNSGGHRLSIYDQGSTLERLEVKVERLDHLIDNAGLPAPDWIKIDAEGAECDILEGLGRHISRLRVLLAETQSRANHEWIIACLRDSGFARIEEQILHSDASEPHESYSIIRAQRD
jgi:FkbM family methyltransferase